MYTLADIGLLLIFSVSFIGSYFIYERVLTFRAFSFLKIRSYVIDSVSGLLFGLFTLVFKLILISIDSSFNVPLFVIVAIILLMVKNMNVSLLAMFIPLIYYTVKNDGVDIVYYLIGYTTAILFIHTIVKYFSTPIWANASVAINTILGSVIGMVVFKFSFGYDFGRLLFESSIFIPLLLAFVYYPLRTAIRTSISANILFESVNFVYSKYIRHPLATDAIGEFIKKNKTQYAFFGLLRIDVESNVESETTEIIETVLTNFEKAIGDDTILFAYDGVTYGFFVPVEEKINLKNMMEGNDLKTRKPYDNLKNIELIIKDLLGSYKTESGKIYNVNVISGVSIYGLQSNSTEQLETNSLNAMAQISSRQIIKMYDPEKSRNRKRDAEELSLMDANINLNNFANSYTNVYPIGDAEDVLTVVKVVNSDEYELIEKVDDLVRLNDWKKTFDRYFSAEVFSRSSSQTLLVEYSPMLDNDFDLKDFMSKLILINIKIDKVIWILSGKDIKGKMNKVKFLSKNGLRFALKDYSISKVTDAGLDSFEFELVDTRIINQKIIRTIYTNATTENDLEWAIKNSVDFIGGNIFEVNSIVTKHDKQSKIYIEEIKERIGLK